MHMRHLGVTSQLRILPLLLSLQLSLADDAVRQGGVGDLVRPVVLVAEDEIHLVDRETLGLGDQEEGPDGSDEHPGGEEEPRPVAEGGEDVGKSLGDGELDGPAGWLAGTITHTQERLC